MKTSTAIVLRDPTRPDPPAAPQPTVKTLKDMLEKARAKTASPGAKIELGSTLFGAMLGDEADKLMSGKLPGMGSMLLGALGAIGAAIVDDPGAKKVFQGIALGAATAGAVKAATGFKPEPEPLFEEAEKAIEFHMGRPLPETPGAIVLKVVRIKPEPLVEEAHKAIKHHARKRRR